MNILSRGFCRSFQTIFRLAIPLLPYRQPKVLDSVTQLPEELAQQNVQNVLIVTDKFLHTSGALEPLKQALRRAHISCWVYDETVPNPTVENVESARTVYLHKGCQALIGFGGGSAIDCAKAVGARIARPKKSISKMRGILQVMKKIPYLIAIPTTAGTGSETTVTTVITDGATHHKFPISDFPLIPRVAVLDPENTRTLPPYLTATTGMDALVHAIEAYIGGSTTKISRSDALLAAKLISENLEQAYADGCNMTARKNMLTAAYHAGHAFSISYVGYCHAVAHSLGGQYHIPHGLANAVLIPYVLESYGPKAYNKLKDLAIAMSIADADTPAEDAAKALIQKIRDMNTAMGIPAKLTGIHAEDIPHMAKLAAKEANPLYPVPVLMDARALEQFYYDVMEDPQ